MKVSKLTIASLLLWFLTVATLGYFFVSGSTKKSSDNRKEVQLTPSERDLILGEMRGLLRGINGVLKGLAQNDQAFIVKSIEPIGMKMAADVNPILMGKLPLEFKQLGMSVHKDFDVLREDIGKGMTNEAIVKESVKLLISVLLVMKLIDFHFKLMDLG